MAGKTKHMAGSIWVAHGGNEEIRGEPVPGHIVSVKRLETAIGEGDGAGEGPNDVEGAHNVHADAEENGDHDVLDQSRGEGGKELQYG